MANTGGIQLVDTFKYSGARFLDLRQHAATLAELVATPETSIPDGFNKYCDETQCWYEYKSRNDIDPETGKWRKSVPIHEMISEEYIFAITDADGAFLFGIREDGEVVYNRGMSDEVRARFSELEGYQPMSNENYIFAITDAGGRVLFGITQAGEVVYDKGIPEEVKPILKRINRDLTDARERIGEAETAIARIKERLTELDGYRVMEDENFIFAITDNIGTLLFGIEQTGHIVMPQGQVQMKTREEYEAIEPKPDTLYIIKGHNGTTEGAYINGQTLNAGEACNFVRDENIIKYRGGMKSKPIIHIDHETMEAKVDYPSDYEGPMIFSDRETKTLFVM